MDRAWYWKAGFIVAVAIGAVYALVPSWTYFKMDATTRIMNEQRDKRQKEIYGGPAPNPELTQEPQ